MHASLHNFHSVTICNQSWTSHLRGTDQHVRCLQRDKRFPLQTHMFLYRFHVHVKHDRCLVLSRGTMHSQPLSGLGRYLDMWNDWCKKDHTVTHNLTFVTCGNDVWEDVKIFICDSSFFFSRNNGGRLIVLAGKSGSTFTVQWGFTTQATTVTSSGDTEAIEWPSTVKGGLRIVEM